MKHSYPSIADIVDSFRCLLVRSFVRCRFCRSSLILVPVLSSCLRSALLSVSAGAGRGRLCVLQLFGCNCTRPLSLFFYFAVGNHTRWSTVFLYVYSYAFCLSLAEPIDGPFFIMCAQQYIFAPKSFISRPTQYDSNPCSLVPFASLVMPGATRPVDLPPSPPVINTNPSTVSVAQTHTLYAHISLSFLVANVAPSLSRCFLSQSFIPAACRRSILFLFCVPSDAYPPSFV
jgi:hypothetical protein